MLNKLKILTRPIYRRDLMVAVILLFSFISGIIFGYYKGYNDSPTVINIEIQAPGKAEPQKTPEAFEKTDETTWV